MEGMAVRVIEKLSNHPWGRGYAVHQRRQDDIESVIVVPVTVDREENYKHYHVFLSYGNRILIDKLGLFKDEL